MTGLYKEYSLVNPKTAINTYIKSAKDAPIFTRLQKRNLPLSALVVIRMLIGPAIGIEKMKPASRPAIDIVIILSVMNPYGFVVNDRNKWII